MANPVIHTVSDVCAEMKQMSSLRSRAPAQGSFATEGMLADFCQALVILCEAVGQLRAEVAELKAEKTKASAAAPPKGSQSPDQAKPKRRP